jgi:hypothetical protein
MGIMEHASRPRPKGAIVHQVHDDSAARRYREAASFVARRLLASYPRRAASNLVLLAGTALANLTNFACDATAAAVVDVGAHYKRLAAGIGNGAAMHVSAVARALSACALIAERHRISVAAGMSARLAVIRIGLKVGARVAALIRCIPATTDGAHETRGSHPAAKRCGRWARTARSAVARLREIRFASVVGVAAAMSESLLTRVCRNLTMPRSALDARCRCHVG